MKNKYAIAVVLSKSDNEILFAKRSSNLSEYSNFWSLPSSVVSKEDYNSILKYGSVPHDPQKKLWDKCFIGDRSVELKFIRSGIRQRTDYRLNMALVGGKITRKLEPRKSKYQKTELIDVLDVLQRQNFQAGTCISLLIQEMVELSRLDSALSYLEVSPELANSKIPIDEISSEELWLKALPNYLLLNAGESGSDGALIKDYSLNRYFKKYIENIDSKNLKILDLGCGGGDLVYQLIMGGYQAKGVDIYPDPMGKYNDSNCKIELYQCKAEDVHSYIDKESTSTVIMNLVVQWIHDLNTAARSIKKIIRKGGRVLVTTVPPEFSKNGYWNIYEGDYSWVVKEPLRRKPFLVMINRTIGPVRFYPRTTPEYISSFTSNGFLCSNTEYIYIDSFLKDEEINNLFSTRPDLRRHTKIPVFLILEFVSK